MAEVIERPLINTASKKKTAVTVCHLPFYCSIIINENADNQLIAGLLVETLTSV